MITQKCSYAVKAVLELAANANGGPVKIGEIAARQRIPIRFLEVILGQLKQGGFLESKRGADGGYQLAKAPGRITVGEVIRFVDGTLAPRPGVEEGRGSDSLSEEPRVLADIWQKAYRALSEVYYGTTFEDLLEQERRYKGNTPVNYVI